MVKEALGVLGDGEIERWGVWEKLKNIYPHHYHAGLPMIGLKKNIIFLYILRS
ncbi:MAG: hypothetical protein QNJ74_20355 [Trichodesmium sp. MO_231.B1]|nr:hypothetical protein [Trichodesmium sp. MO_231.B1]